MNLDLHQLFSGQGPLAEAIPGYKLRPQQIEMAQAILEAIKHQDKLVVEAGTGTGKTLAYLVPALLAGGKVVISTGTKTLQDQLFLRDIPALRDALKLPVTVAILKGRANYVCRYHLDRSQLDARLYHQEDVRHLQNIVRFATVSPSGDKSGCHDVPESASVWAYATSTRDNCLGQDCTEYKDCFVMAARKQALAADVVVVNHHLFFADVMLKDEGMAELLPAANTIILDEAHQLPSTAGLFFGTSLGTGQLIELVRDARAEGVSHAKDFAPLPEAASALEMSVRDLRLVFPQEGLRLPYERAQRFKEFEPALISVKERLTDLEHALESQSERAPGLENCWQRAQALNAQLKAWREVAAAGNTVRWVEVYSHAVQLNTTPLSIAETFKAQLEAPRTWIFTSATLAVKGDFRHYQEEMGLDDAKTAYWNSPFDYANQALLYVPQHLPEPNTPDYTRAVVEAALPVVQASGGRAFLLFTSLRAMREAHAQLQEEFKKLNLDFPLLLQGEGSRTELLERFRRLGNAVLVASHSFWEGVDVRGSALSLVIIDRLPFAVPDDPVLSARIEKMNNEGRNAFMEYQLPQAVITLKQGAGRLIRDETDHGVLMICDPRLLSKPYGKRIWQSLPPMRRTRELSEVEAFFDTPHPVPAEISA
ncbi:MAG: ATP-dependent DNA helicase [Pseudomonadota bacterium]